MPLRNKRLVELQPADIRGLITRGVAENQFVDFKEQMYIHSDDGKHELVKDISSFANAYGGDILIGIDAPNGVATQIEPVRSAAKEVEWLLQVCHDLIDERISGLDAVPVRLRGGSVIVVRIPPSLRGPHMVRRGRQTYFYRRYGQQSAPMSLPDLREAFMRFATWRQQADDFIAQRRRDISTRPIYVVGVLPIPIQNDLISIADDQIVNLLGNPPNTRPAGWRAHAGRDIRVTLFGFLSRIPGISEIQLWRNGYLEFSVDVDERNLDNLRIVAHTWDELPGRPTAFVIGNSIPTVEFAVTTLRLARTIQRHAGYEGPNAVWLYFSAFGPPSMPRQGLVGPEPGDWEMLGPQALEVPMPYPIQVGPYQADSIADPDSVAKKLLDSLWNAFGHLQAPLFMAGGGPCIIDGLPPYAN